MKITADHIIELAPRCSLGWAVALVDTMPRWGINSIVRIEMFLAQCAHESAGFTKFEENLNYSAEALMRTWPSRFPNMSVAGQYARNPEKIANYVYADRLGNGNEASGDGYLFRGRGIIQLTGKSNYQKAGDAIHYPFERYPQDMASPTYGSQASCWFWESNGLNELADQGKFTVITQRINGGQTGAASRELWLATARATINDDPKTRLV